MKNYFETTGTIAERMVQDVCFKISNGDIKAGEKLLSISDMSLLWKVSPDTVVRAYAQLEQLSLIETKRGLGTFVTRDESVIKIFRSGLILQKINNFINEMLRVGITVNEIIDFINPYNPIERYNQLPSENAEELATFLSLTKMNVAKNECC